MRISLVIPVYNQGQYLDQAIYSVLTQTQIPSELIIVNDGSTDNSLEVAKSHLDNPHIPLKIINQVNKGLSSARNTGIMNATGDYVFFLDADDIMQENCIERVLRVIEETGADVVAPSFKAFGINNGDVILMPNPMLKDFKFTNGYPQNRIGYFSAIKKDALLEVGGYSPKMIWGWEDLHLTINLLSRGKKIVTIPEVLILYRTKEHSMINDANAHATELTAQIFRDFPSVND